MNWPKYGDPRLPERFWDKISLDPDTGCWIWAGSVCNNGFGQYKLHGRLYAAHKVAYNALVGEMMSGRMSQTCSLKACCNPRHQRLTRSSTLRGPTALFSPGQQRVVWRRVPLPPSAPRPALPALTVSQGVRVAANIEARSRALVACVQLVRVQARVAQLERDAALAELETRESVAA